MIQNSATSNVTVKLAKTYNPNTLGTLGGRRRNHATPNALETSVQTRAFCAPTHLTSLAHRGVTSSVPSATATYTNTNRSGGRRLRNKVSRAVSTWVCPPMVRANNMKASPNARPSPERSSRIGGIERRATGRASLAN